MNPRELEETSKAFALRILGLADTLPRTRSGNTLANQIVRSGTSVGANCRAANRGRSRSEFIAKLGLVVEEIDEIVYWLDLIMASDLVKPSLLEPLRAEASELLAIFSRSRATAKANHSTASQKNS